MTGDRRDDMATEARDLVRRAAGDTSGLTIKGQIRRAVENLGYGAAGWRVREAWYGRAGRWVGTALRELHERFAAWRDRQRDGGTPAALAHRLGAVRDGLAELQRRFGELEAEVARTLSVHQRAGDGGPAVDA